MTANLVSKALLVVGAEVAVEGGVGMTLGVMGTTKVGRTQEAEEEVEEEAEVDLGKILMVNEGEGEGEEEVIKKY